MGPEFEALRDFFTFLKQAIPDALLFPQYIAHRLEVAGQVWLGALALLAACPDLEIDAVVGHLSLVKAQNQLLHARFATDQGRWINNMISAVEKREFVRNLKSQFEGMSIEQVKAETKHLIGQACRLDKRSLDRLNTNRPRIARAYGAMEIGELLSTTFRNPMELSLVFDIYSIVQNWSNLQKKTNCVPLPTEIKSADLRKLASDQEILQKVIQHTIYAVADKGLPSTTISFEIVLRDLQKCINDKRIPTGGLVFDGDHASAIRCCEIFMTTDDSLAHSMRTIARSIEEQSSGKSKRAVAVNAKQLKEALIRVQSC